MSVSCGLQYDRRVNNPADPAVIYPEQIVLDGVELASEAQFTIRCVRVQGDRLRGRLQVWVMSGYVPLVIASMGKPINMDIGPHDVIRMDMFLPGMPARVMGPDDMLERGFAQLFARRCMLRIRIEESAAGPMLVFELESREDDYSGEDSVPLEETGASMWFRAKKDTVADFLA